MRSCFSVLIVCIRGYYKAIDIQYCLTSYSDGKTSCRQVILKHLPLLRRPLQRLTVHHRLVDHIWNERKDMLSAESLAEYGTPGFPFMLAHVEHVRPAGYRLEEAR